MAIRFETRDRIAIITRDRPERRNALSQAMLADLEAVAAFRDKRPGNFSGN